LSTRPLTVLTYRTCRARVVQWPASRTDMGRAWITLLPRQGALTVEPGGRVL